MAIPYAVCVLKEKHVSVEFDRHRGEWIHTFSPPLSSLESEVIAGWMQQEFARVKRRPMQSKPKVLPIREERQSQMIFSFKKNADGFLSALAMRIENQFGAHQRMHQPVIRTAVLPAPRTPK